MSGGSGWNYISRIVEFYSRQQVAPLSARAQAFYHSLLWHCNMAHGRQPLSLREPLLRAELSLGHKPFLAARSELQEGGYIKTRSRPGGLACLYFLPELSSVPAREALTEDEAIRY